MLIPEHHASPTAGKPASGSPAAPFSASNPASRASARRPLQRLAVTAASLALIFSIPLLAWLKFARHSELYSYILLIPFVSSYLLWTDRARWLPAISPGVRAAIFPFLSGAATLGFYSLALRSGWVPTTVNYLAAMSLAFLFFFWSACFVFLGSTALRQGAFPFLFLLFIIPFPDAARHAAESFLQHTSADAAYLFLKLSG
ncbi:MAG: archaeosortase/exosortase family protein, partial [Verrucomicrobiota bacterium]